MKLQPIVVTGVILLLAGIVFLAVESGGRVFESRFGLICLVCIAALSFLGAYLQKTNTDSDKQNDQKSKK
ncbi:MAG: hypothetical protein LBV12_00875 [Puniceicoccales bacterium]|jgi:membrane-bound ClpP family serine protease|nr:hypothetical protein [Puniceicoccales bacterium]